MFGVQKEGLTDEQRLIITTVDRMMQKYDDEYWHDLEAAKKYPEEFVREMDTSGLAALTIGHEFGGSELGIREASLVLEEINALGGNSQPFHGQYYLSFMLGKYASKFLKEKYLPQVASGKLRLQSLALTEPEAGSESTRIKTLAKRNDDDNSYNLSGRKIFISRVEQTDLMIVVARTKPYEEVENKTEGISIFLVDLKDSPNGIEARRIDMMFNSQTYELVFDNLKVPKENLIGEEGRGFKCLLGALNPERILLASECIGDARWFLKKSVDYANSRVVFGRQIGANQGVQFPIAETYSKLVAAEKVRWSAAELYDAGAEARTIGEYANIAKYLAAECSWQAANVAMDVYGGQGLAVDSHIERKLRETRLYKVAPIAQNLVLAYIAHSVLGLPRSY
ncbi:MAG: acyl-CoA dehydrogenase family protein [Nitrososphaerales archaeon]